MKILSIETNVAAARTLGKVMVGHGHEFINVTSGTAGLMKNAELRPDMLIPRFDLGDMSVLSLIQDVRNQHNMDTPIIVLGMSRDEEACRCLDEGADDYLEHPYETGELLLRMRAVAKRCGPRPTILFAGLLTYHPGEAVFRICGDRVELSTEQHGILLALLKAKGRIFTDQQLYNTYQDHVELRSNVVQVMISRLRTKLHPHAQNTFKIETVRSLGYRLQPL